LIVLTLATGCFKQAAPDVTATPAGGAQVEPSEEVTPDLMATAAANATRAAEAAAETPATEQPTPLPTPTPWWTPTSEPATPTSVAATPTTEALGTPVATTPVQTPTSPPAGQVTHTVQRGENLFRIALRYGTTVQAIASANGITNPALIYAGQTLRIPTTGGQQPPATGTTYVVQPGDNLFRIALRYNLSYTYLAQYNGIANPAHIYVGQVLRIPPH